MHDNSQQKKLESPRFQGSGIMGAQHEKLYVNIRPDVWRLMFVATSKGLIPFLLLVMLFQNSKRFGFTLSATTENNWLLVAAEIAGLADPIFIHSNYMISV